MVDLVPRTLPYNAKPKKKERGKIYEITEYSKITSYRKG